MNNITIDDNGFWTGMACKVGRFANGIDVQSIPNELDSTKQKAYKYKDNQWLFDERRYQELLAEKLSLQKENQSNEEYLSNKQKLSKLSEDIIQSIAGIYIPNLEEKKNEFKNLLNQVRIFEGKNPKLNSSDLINENISHMQ